MTTARHNRALTAWSACAYLVVFLIVLPILWIVLLSFQPSDRILSNPLSFDALTLSNYSDALGTLPLLRMYGNTLMVAIVSVTLGAVISFMAAFALTRMVFRHRRLQSSLRFFLLAGLAVPVYILLFPIYRIVLELHLFGTWGALILPYISVTIPFNVLLLTGFLRDFPAELEEAAEIGRAHV